MLLVKEKKYEQAISKHIDMGKFDKAEDFCMKNKSAGLLTILLEQYFNRYDDCIKQGNQGNLQKNKEAEEFRKQALRLMEKYSAEDLDPTKILDKVPDDWLLKTDEYDLVSFLSSIFTAQMTREENSKIAKNLVNMEYLSAEKEKNDLQSAYLVIREDDNCLVCKQKLGHKKIRIFPHGLAFHMRCAKDPQECPITKQRFGT